MREFIEQYADSIICEPSGLTYTDLRSHMTQKIMIVNKEVDKHKEITNIIDDLF